MEGTTPVTPEVKTGRAENERQYSVLDQMLTMHSVLRDKLERRAFWLNTALILSSLFLLVFSFVGDDILDSLGFKPGMTRFALGLASTVALLGSITEFRVDWRSVAGKHSEASARLGALKAMYRKSFTETQGNDPNANSQLTLEYDKVMAALPPIPDRWFNVLKSKYQFKKLLSKEINQHPTAPIFLLRTQLRIKGILEVLWTKTAKGSL
jgi:hypothetical protein